MTIPPLIKIRDYKISIHHVNVNCKFLYIKTDDFQIPLAIINKDLRYFNNNIVDYFVDIIVEDAISWFYQDGTYYIKNRVVYRADLTKVLYMIRVNCAENVVKLINTHYNNKKLEMGINIKDNNTHYNLNPAYLYDRNSKIIPKEKKVIEESLFKNRVSELIYLMKAADDKNDLKEAYKYLDLLIEELKKDDKALEL